MPLIPEFRRQRQGALSEFEPSLVYKASSRTAKLLHREQNKTKKYIGELEIWLRLKTLVLHRTWVGSQQPYKYDSP